MVVAMPMPRRAFEALNFSTVSHITSIEALTGIVKREIGRSDPWTDCEVELVATSGFDMSKNRLLRDYSVIDFEFTSWGKERGKYTYFFAGEPSGWGLFKNIPKSLRRSGFATVQVKTADLLARTSSPLFFRLDDCALVIRGGYIGPARVNPRPIRLITET
jgi:hypothetical protein